ncbi:MAG: T9SS type A sorting domain-containing protein [Ignavibacteria bacterium]|nr:T9SS type A sorting domain-containing protein [Ignavibacteria bacterium]
MKILSTFNFDLFSSEKFLGLILSFIFLFGNTSFAQLSESGIPYSFKNTTTSQVVTLQMPSIDIEALLIEDEQDDLKGIPFRFGFPIETDINLFEQGTFERLSNGDKLWSLRIYAPGATSINLNYNDFWLPEGAKLFIYNDTRNEVIGAFTKRNNKENGEFATGILRGEAITLEYYEPAFVESPAFINISSVVHGYKDVFKKLETDDFGSSGSCNNNVICPEGDNWRNEIRAAAMILTSSGSRLCSGVMINNVRQDLTPYFLTANHCVGSSSANWIIMFKYQSPQCSPSVNGPLNYTVQGTQLKANNSSSDFALFTLVEAPPDSFEVHFSGWSAINVPSTNSVGIHHPSGDVKKISFDYHPTVSSDYTPSPYLPNSHWEITMWDDGTTEPGSSGSPLYDQNKRITGQLHGGWASCTSLTQDYYGKFAMSWNYGSTPATRLKDWLDPDNTGSLILDGWDPTIGEPDTIPPTTIANLAVIDPTSNSLKLTWTAPLDTSYGGVKAYDIRRSNVPINDIIAFNNATQIPFSGQPATAGSPESIEITGLNFNTTYYFAIRSRDFWQNWSMISNSPGGNTLFAPQVAVNPVSVYNVMMPAMVVIDTVLISNSSTNSSTLDYSISLVNNTFPGNMMNARVIPVANQFAKAIVDSKEDSNEDPNEDIYGLAIEGQGGPDLFGYKWIDSNEPNGPQYVWYDITTNPSAVLVSFPNGTLDDGYTNAIPLGFNMKYYGTEYPNIYLSTNGFLSFTALTSSTYTNAQIPGTAVPNNMVAMFWDDLDGRTQGTVHRLQDGNKFYIQFTNWQKYLGTGSLTFQVVLYQNGKIMVYYNNMNATLNSATVGIENAAGNDGLQVTYNANYVQNNLAIQFSAEPDWLSNNNSSGRIYNGNSLAVELTFHSEDYPLGYYSMDMLINSNDPGTPSLTVPVSMDVVIPVELTSFNLTTDNNNVNLRWSTATETNNHGFSIERKINGKSDWSEITFIEGNGTTTEKIDYNFTDKSLAVGLYSYRLKQNDLDGTFSYSKEIEVEVVPPKEFALYQNYPNPFNPSTTIKFSLPVQSQVKLNLYNNIGEQVAGIYSGALEAGYHEVNFNGSELSSGVYFYSIEAGEFRSVKKMMLIK